MIVSMALQQIIITLYDCKAAWALISFKRLEIGILSRLEFWVDPKLEPVVNEDGTGSILVVPKEVLDELEVNFVVDGTSL